MNINELCRLNLVSRVLITLTFLSNISVGVISTYPLRFHFSPKQLNLTEPPL